jgi:flavocytochrome c
MEQVIVVGGGLAGLSAAHTVIENGGRVVVIDKSAFMGGNSTKATSGINGAGTVTQRLKKIPDTPEIFENDTATSAKEGVRPGLVKVLTHQSGPAVDWLMNKFGLDLSLVSRLGGHSQPRTHRGKERFPGMTITYALMEAIEAIEKETNGKTARVITKACVNELITEGDAVVGVKYEKGGESFSEMGPVIITTGGFGADFADDSLLAEVSKDWRGLSAWNDVKKLPELRTLPTTNGDHCTGDGIKMGLKIGAKTCDMEAVQVHPTGLVDPNEPDSKLKFLAAEALRGCGGLILDRNGKRFVDELQKRDHVSGRMWNNQGPFRLVLNGGASKEIEWHCKHYSGRGLMKYFKNGEAIAKEMNIDPAVLDETFKTYSAGAASGKDPFGKKYFSNVPVEMNDSYGFHVAIITPVVHYTMGGLEGDEDSQVLSANGKIPGLYTAGEAMGGVHGKNRLGGNSLLDCVAFGRVAGDSASRYLFSHALDQLSNPAMRRAAVLGGHFSVTMDQGGMSTTFTINQTPSGAATAAAPVAVAAAPAAPAVEAAAPAAAAPAAAKTFTLDDVAKHKTDKDCWVVVNGEVLDCTDFLKDHPGGKKAIMLFAGKDASEEFNMLHKPDVVHKYLDEGTQILGKLA